MLDNVTNAFGPNSADFCFNTHHHFYWNLTSVCSIPSFIDYRLGLDICCIMLKRSHPTGTCFSCNGECQTFEHISLLVLTLGGLTTFILILS